MQIEGKNAIREAIKSKLTINKIMVDQNFANRRDDLISLARQNKIRVEFVPKTGLDRKSTTSHHQGYIADCVDFQYSSLSSLIDKNNNLPLIVMLDGIEDPHNFGAIIRSCECAGVDGIVIPKNRACQVNDTVIRTSTGAIANVKIAQVTNLKDAIEYFKNKGLWIYAAETGGDIIYKQNLKKPIAVIIGSEGKGVKPSIVEKCDGILTLPLEGQVNSLNASVACGLTIFEILRQRKYND